MYYPKGSAGLAGIAKRGPRLPDPPAYTIYCLSFDAYFQVAALEALSLILPHHPPAAALALAHPGAAARLAGPLLRHPDPAVRLLAAGCLATLSRAPQCPQETSEVRIAVLQHVLQRLGVVR